MKLKIYLLNYQDLSLDYLLNSSFLTSADISSFQKFNNENVKKERIVSTILKHKYIGEYHLNEYGKPLSNDKYFNISHSNGYIALVIDEVPVGIDIEKIREVDDSLIEYISNEQEKEFIKDNESFFQVWTNKEALVKAYGSGIKEKIKTIPGLPLNGIRIYKGYKFYNKTINNNDLIITISRESKIEFDIDIIKEVI